MRANSHLRVLEADSPRPPLPCQLGERLEQVVTSPHDVIVRDLALRALHVAEVGDEGAPPVSDQDGSGVPVNPVR